MKAKRFWEQIYQQRDPTTDVSWYEPQPLTSLELIRIAGVSKEGALIDVGGGASVLVDCLLKSGFSDVTVLDISATALNHAQQRLGSRAARVAWVETDITLYNPSRCFQLWHDRAVFHFLTSPEDRRSYITALRSGLSLGGHLIIGTFAKDGPPRCTGLPVVRYDSDSLCYELGPDFQLIHQKCETHITPWDSKQRFHWFLLKRCSEAALPSSLNPS
jgi:hypothetical protein